MKKHCNFCGEPMLEASAVCKQCGWDRRQDAPPTQDPGDKKARLGVTAGLIVAYGIMFSVASGAGTGDRPVRAAKSPSETAAPTNAPEPVTGEAIALGRLPSEPATAADLTKPGALITIKVADAKAAPVPARDALQYLFSVPETEQKCALVGSTHGVSGFGRDIEVFLLTDDEYIFWNANPAAMPRSSWEPVQGSENTLNYQLPGAGTYHLVISNVMSPTPKTIQVKAQVKCVK